MCERQATPAGLALLGLDRGSISEETPWCVKRALSDDIHLAFQCWTLFSCAESYAPESKGDPNVLGTTLKKPRQALMKSIFGKNKWHEPPVYPHNSEPHSHVLRRPSWTESALAASNTYFKCHVPCHEQCTVCTLLPDEFS